MKKLFPAFVCLLLAIFIACPAMAVSAQTEPQPGDILQAYRRVLAGEEGYVQYDPDSDMLCDPRETTDAETVMTDAISAWYGYQFDPPFMFTGFAVVDLDADGSPELLLQLSNDFGYELLRYHEGRVYGYPFVYRGMEAVTTDGEIHAASGADNFGWYRLSFDGYILRPEIICWTDDMAAEGEQYQINGSVSTEEAFTQMNEALWAKPLLTLTKLTPEALAEALGRE